MGKTRRKFSLRIAVRDAPETVTPAVARPSKRGKTDAQSSRTQKHLPKLLEISTPSPGMRDEEGNRG